MSDFSTLSTLLASEMEGVNALILERLADTGVPLIPQIASHLIKAGGKRLRPLLALASGHIAGADPHKTALLAAAVEFIHSATLLHDDVVDASAKRRGRPSAPVTFGNKASVLVGDTLFARSFEMMVEAGSLPALSALASASATIARGEVAQLAAIGDIKDASWARYFDIIEAKTAALFSAACKAPALLVHSPHAAALAAYGRALGLAFQIVDDVLDYSDSLGKEPGDDFREGKITAPVLVALEGANAKARDFWTRTLAHHDQTPQDLAQAKALLDSTHALAKTQDIAKRYAQEARDALKEIPDIPMRGALEHLSHYAAAR